MKEKKLSYTLCNFQWLRKEKAICTMRCTLVKGTCLKFSSFNLQHVLYEFEGCDGNEWQVSGSKIQVSVSYMFVYSSSSSFFSDRRTFSFLSLHPISFLEPDFKLMEWVYWKLLENREVVWHLYELWYQESYIDHQVTWKLQSYTEELE